MLRWIWRLYPRSFRERFGREFEEDLRLREAAGRRARLPDVVDALVTLVRLWLRAGAQRLSVAAMSNDVSHATRVLRRSPGYALGVVCILALALGANTAVFSVAYRVLLEALPYDHPEQIYALEPSPLRPGATSWTLDPEFLAWPQIQSAAFYIDGGGANLGVGDVTGRVDLAQVTEGFFDVLGVSPLIGRTFGSAEPDAAVISEDLWIRAYAADPAVVGRQMTLSGRSVTIVGVLPEDVEFPSAVDVWLSFPPSIELFATAITPWTIARLRPGVGIDEIRAAMQERWDAQYALLDDPPPGLTFPPVRVTALPDQLTGSVKAPLYVLVGISGLVVLLGCLNLAGLVMARTFQRSAELSIRRALGASRVRLFSQLVLEVLLLSGLAGLAGLGAASLTIGTLTGMLPPETPGLDEVGLATPVLLFAGGVALLAGLTVGTVPSLLGAWAGVHPRAVRTATTDGPRRRTQTVLVTGQVAVATVLVVGAMLLGRSLRNLQAVPLGYDLEHVLTFHVQLPPDAYPDIDARRAYLASAEEALGRISGVSAVGASTFLPRQEGLTVGLRLVPVGRPPANVPSATSIQVTPGYFEAMGMRLLRGVPFSGGGVDRWDQVVITETLARQLFEDGDAVGARADIDGGTRSISTTIGAVVSDVHLRGRQADPTKIVYSSLAAAPRAGMGFAVRATGSPSTLVARVREAVLSVDSSVPPYEVTTTGQAAGREIATERAIAILSRLFSVSALLLTALGLYGVVAQGIAERRRELGIRLVLGAEARQLVRAVLYRPLSLTTVGLAIGATAAALMATRLSSMLFEVSPRDPAIFAVVAVAVLAVIAVAAYAPARRIVRIDPAESLRAE